MLWKKDFEVADWVTQFTVGNDYYWDNYLLPFDVEASLCHAMALVQIGILSDREFSDIKNAMESLLEELEKGEIQVNQVDEDCHTVIERYLTDKLGDTGKKIHTARSRNDQVLAALRLYIKDSLKYIASKTGKLATLLCDHADSHENLLLPGYTHMQRAMPSTVASWACGFAELFLSDLASLYAAYNQIDTNPLGSAAGYGVPFLTLPRDQVTKCLDFATTQLHVTGVQLSRGKLELHVAHALAQLGATLNRMASDLVLYNTAEYNFVKLPAEYCTGSSIMPQKQNPDVLELIRAYYHRLIAEMNVLITLPANLPSGYHRDLQLTKESVMKAIEVVKNCIAAMIAILEGMNWNEDSLKKAITPELFATAAALKKVNEGVPFRDAYRLAANEVDSWSDLDKEMALSSYQTEGSPGNEFPDRIRKAISEKLELFHR